MEEIRLERILRAVECVPEGEAATYGLIGRVVGEVPRVIGNVLYNWGSTVPWWRIVNAQGVIPGHEESAREHWQREGLLDAASGPERPRIRLAEVLTSEDELRLAWERAIADL